MRTVSTPQLRFSFLLREIESLSTSRGVRSLGMVLIRLAGLQAVNESHGYVAGDQLLEDFGRRLTSIARAQDKIFQIPCNHIEPDSGHIFLQLH